MSKKSNSTRTNSASQTQPGLNKARVNEFVTSANNIVVKAASILEEEIAKGVVAAKEVEKKVFSRKKQDRSQDELMSKFRSHSHDVLDMVFDLLSEGIETYKKTIDQTLGDGKKRQ